MKNMIGKVPRPKNNMENMFSIRLAAPKENKTAV
jgi:hypothetical protein